MIPVTNEIVAAARLTMIILLTLLVLSIGLAFYAGYRMATDDCIYTIEKSIKDLQYRNRDKEVVSMQDFNELQALLKLHKKIVNKDK